MINLANGFLRQIALEEQVTPTNYHYSIRQAEKMKTLCHSLVNELRVKLVSHHFLSELDEIEFFKKAKPQVLAKLIYYCELFHYLKAVPLSTDKNKKKYITQRLNKIERFTNKHQDFINYIQLDQDQMDAVYFLRKNFNPVAIPHYSLWNMNCDLATNKDYLVAMILAYEELVQFFKYQISEGELCKCTKDNKSTKISDIQWTCSKASLIELIYALRESGAINNGDIEIRDLTNNIEKWFNIDLGEPYKTFNDIKTKRKKQASFLETLRRSFLNLLD